MFVLILLHLLLSLFISSLKTLSQKGPQRWFRLFFTKSFSDMIYWDAGKSSDLYRIYTLLMNGSRLIDALVTWPTVHQYCFHYAIDPWSYMVLCHLFCWNYMLWTTIWMHYICFFEEQIKQNQGLHMVFWTSYPLSQTHRINWNKIAKVKWKLCKL